MIASAEPSGLLIILLALDRDPRLLGVLLEIHSATIQIQQVQRLRSGQWPLVCRLEGPYNYVGYLDRCG